MPTKTILIPVLNSFVVRNVLRTEIFDYLKNNSQLKMVLLAPKDKVEYYSREFALQKNAIIESFPTEEPLNKFEAYIDMAIYNSIPTKTIKIKQNRRFFKAWIPFPKRLTIFIFQRMLWHLSKFRIWKKGLRLFYLSLPSHDIYKNLLKRYHPDLVLITNLLRIDELRLLKEARKLKIKTAILLLSRDNLTAKVFLIVKPDKLIVYNNLIKDEAIKYHDISGKDIFVSGVPQYDNYFRQETILPKEVFFQKIGADIKKRLIFFTGGSKPFQESQSDIIDILKEALETNQIKKPVQILLRPYPKYDLTPRELETIKSSPNFILDNPVFHIGKTGTDSWELKKDAINHITNLFYHSDVVMTFYSTIFVESCILNKPVININFDGYKNKRYLFSVRRFFDYEHIENVFKNEGVRNVDSKEELIEAINQYLKNPSLNEPGRKKTALEQCYKMDGLSGKRIAEFINSLL